MTITARSAPNAAPARLKVRKNIESLSAQELTDFRLAVKQAIALNDKRGFDYLAGWHGVPLGWCQHHDLLFLPWHRAYLYWLELALQSQVPAVTLPSVDTCCAFAVQAIQRHITVTGVPGAPDRHGAYRRGVSARPRWPGGRGRLARGAPGSRSSVRAGPTGCGARAGPPGRRRVVFRAAWMNWYGRKGISNSVFCASPGRRGARAQLLGEGKWHEILGLTPT